MLIPKIKKKITSFLLEEEGKISKHSLLSLGSFISAAVIGGILASKEAAATHTNSLSVAYASGAATGTHAHHQDGVGYDSACACGACMTGGTGSACGGGGGAY